MPDQPTAPNMRSFSLNSDEGHAALRVPRDPCVWAGGLPREPRWPRREEGVLVDADSDAEAARALGGWLLHVQTGNIPIR